MLSFNPGEYGVKSTWPLSAGIGNGGKRAFSLAMAETGVDCFSKRCCMSICKNLKLAFASKTTVHKVVLHKLETPGGIGHSATSRRCVTLPEATF